MGFTEILTIVFIVLKLIGVISWSWWLVLLPEIIALGIYVIIFVLSIVGVIGTNRKVKKHVKKHFDDFDF